MTDIFLPIINSNGTGMPTMSYSEFSTIFTIIPFPNSIPSKHVVSFSNGDKLAFFALSGVSMMKHLILIYDKYSDVLRQDIILGTLSKYDICHCFPEFTNKDISHKLGVPSIYHIDFILDEDGNHIITKNKNILVITDLFLANYSSFGELTVNNAYLQHKFASALLLHTLYISYKYLGFLVGGFVNNSKQIILLRKNGKYQTTSCGIRAIASSGQSKYCMCRSIEHILMPIILDTSKSEMSFSMLNIDGIEYDGFNISHDFEGNIIHSTDSLSLVNGKDKQAEASFLYGTLSRNSIDYDIKNVYNTIEFKNMKRNRDLCTMVDLFGKSSSNEIAKIIKKLFCDLDNTKNILLSNNTGLTVLNYSDQLTKNEDLFSAEIFENICLQFDNIDSNLSDTL